MQKDWIDRQIVEVLPDTDPLSSTMRTHFRIVKVAKHYTQAEKNELLQSSYTADGQLILRRRYYVDWLELPEIKELSGVAKTTTLNTIYAKKTAQPVMDLTALKETDIIKDSFKIQITTNSFDKGGSISIGTCSIGTGMDYATINAFEAGLAATLTGSVTGYIELAYTDGSQVVFAGVTAAESKGIYVVVPTAYRHQGIIGTGFFVMTPSAQMLANTSVIKISEKFVHLDGIAISGFYTSESDSCWGISLDDGSGNCTISNFLIFKCNNACAFRGIFLTNSNNGEVGAKIYNGVITNLWSVYAKYGIYQLYNRADSIYNVTITSISSTNTDGIGFRGAGATIKNVICTKNKTDYSGSFSITSTNNLSGDTTVPSSGTFYPSSVVTFTNPNTGDYSLSSTDTGAINLGANLSSDAAIPFSTDIIGTSRPQGASWDIGAFEYVSAEPPVSGGKRRNPYTRGFVLQ